MEDWHWALAGYPVLTGAIGVLWKAWRKKDKEVQELTAKLLAEKERHIQELEDFRRLANLRRWR